MRLTTSDDSTGIPSTLPSSQVALYLSPVEAVTSAVAGGVVLALAQRLPFELLSHIFFISTQLGEQQEWGGVYRSWVSHEDTSSLSSVCKAWRLPAQHMFFKSCSLLSATSAEAFVRTLVDRPDLAEKVQYLVVGLSEEETWPSSEVEEVGAVNPLGVVVGKTQAETSAAMITALRACPYLRHLHVRPLHDSARDGLIAALKVTELETLICSPRLRKPTVEWTGCMFHREDITELVLPSLRNFELDAWSIALPSSPGGTEIEPLHPIPPFSSRIVKLRLRFDTSDDHLFAVLSAAGPTLEVADIYMERMVSLEGAATALAPALSTMREMRWTTNPPVEGFGDVNLSRTPLFFDRLLPRFEVLERLTISATDVSPALLSLVPDSLVDLEVQAYTYRGPFRFEEQMLTTLDDRAVTLRCLKRFTVYDSEEVWSDQNVEAMTRACVARGIIFKFVPDEEGDTDSG